MGVEGSTVSSSNVPASICHAAGRIFESTLPSTQDGGENDEEEDGNGAFAS